MHRKKLFFIIFALNFMVFIFTCGNKNGDSSSISCSDINKIFIKSNENFLSSGVEIYVDVSKPMGNFIDNEITPFFITFANLEMRLNAKYGKNIQVYSFGNQIETTDNSLLRFAKYEIKESVFQAASTRLDLVFNKINQSNEFNKLFIIISDAEAEGEGGTRQNPLTGNLVSSIASIFDKNLSLRIIGIKSKWAGSILRPFYVFLIGSYQEVEDFSLFESSDDIEFKSLTISKDLLKIKSKIDLVDDQCENMSLKDAKEEGFELEFKQNHKMKLFLNVTIDREHSQTYVDLKNNLSPALEYSTFKVTVFEECYKITEKCLFDLKSKGLPEDLLVKLDQIKDNLYIKRQDFISTLQNTIGEELTDAHQSLIFDFASKYGEFQTELANAVIQIQNTIIKPDSNKIVMIFDIMPFNWKQYNYVVQCNLIVGKNDLRLNIPAWIEDWSTNQATDKSKTYLFSKIVEALINQKLISQFPFQLAQFNLLF